MRSLSSIVSTALFVSLAAAQVIGGPFDCLPAGQYTLCQNLWGASAGVGSQSSNLDWASGNSVGWSTTYNWANNPYNVKSYANVIANNAKGKQLQSVGSAPTTWSWYHVNPSAGLRTDVAYDIWLGWASSGNPATSASSYEIMIWLSGTGGAGPLGSQVAWNLNIGGYNWNLWSGPNSNWQVFSFVSAQGDINNFSTDLKQFFNYLVGNQGVSTWQYVQAIQAGTEPFTGSAMLVTSSYSASLQ